MQLPPIILKLGERAKFLTTTAKQPHAFEYIHNEIGYNFRMPNLNAALACAQLEQLDYILDKKRTLANGYELFFQTKELNLEQKLRIQRQIIG